MTREARSPLRRNRASADRPGYERLLYLAIARSANDALVVSDPDGTITCWNASAERIFGYRADEMIGSSFSRIVAEESRGAEAAVMDRMAAGATLHYESLRVTKSLARLKVRGAICPVQDDAGTLVGALRMESEAGPQTPLDEARARLASIVESSDDAIISKNLDGTVTSWNQAACRLFGYAAEEMVGQSILKIVPKDLHPEEAEILRKIRLGERIDHYETRRLRKSGDVVEVSLTISPIRDASGNVVGSSKIAREISERKKMERVLIQSEKLAATGRMAATLAHEINNPLDSVMNLVYLARTSLADGSKAKPYLLTAERELERVSHIARQTLGYYRDPGPPSQVQLEEVLEEVLTVYHSRMVVANIAADCAFAHRKPVIASKGELMQIFSNLVINAIDAMPDGGVLNIETREVERRGVEVVVRDKGIGISAENLERVFEPFFSTKRNVGTGIGLWVARQLLEKRGGSISIESNTQFPSNGTTVSVFLPFQA